jgi:hypothetical protein
MIMDFAPGNRLSPAITNFQLPTIKNSHHPEPFFDWQAFALRAYALPDAAIGKANTPHPSHIYLHIRSNSLNYRLPE